MNFVLDMLGRAALADDDFPRGGAWHDGRAGSLSAIAAAAAAGDFSRAADRAAALAARSHGICNFLAAGQLHLMACHYPEAQSAFAHGSSRLVKFIGHRVRQSRAYLATGRYTLAAATFRRSRAAADALLIAEAGFHIAYARRATLSLSLTSVQRCAALSDRLLRAEARVHLTSSFADALRERGLREDLAVWALRASASAASHAADLLHQELPRLRAALRASPDHADLNYRLGLLARTTGDAPLAESCFARVLRAQPHHLGAATRLAAMAADPPRAAAILAVAFAIPAETLRRYRALAAGIREGGSFDRDVASFCLTLPADARATARANIAFALGEMGLLDDLRAEWKSDEHLLPDSSAAPSAA